MRPRRPQHHGSPSRPAARRAGGLRRTRAVHQHSPSPAAVRASRTHSSTSVTKRVLPGGTSPSSTRWVRTRTGMPPWWSPCQRPASSNDRRPRDHRTGRERLPEHGPAGAVGVPVVEPVEQPESAVSELLPRPVVRAGDVPVERHRHGEPNRAVCRGRRRSPFPCAGWRASVGETGDGSGSHRSCRRLARMRMLHLGLRVTDLDRSLAFYTALGYAEARPRPRHPVRQPDHAPAA